jgi:uncharacterized DUF497 family protein
MGIVIGEFQWDDGNWPKCGKHGVSQEEIEALFISDNLAIHPALGGDFKEERFLAIGKGPEGRWLLVAFTLRDGGGGTLIRPISARYMHMKEVEHYEQQKEA